MSDPTEGILRKLRETHDQWPNLPTEEPIVLTAPQWHRVVEIARAEGAAAVSAAVEAVIGKHAMHNHYCTDKGIERGVDTIDVESVRDVLQPDAARKHDAAVRAEAWADVADALEAVYPTDIWPEGNETTDRIGASMGRANARFIRHYAEQRADAEGADHAD